MAQVTGIPKMKKVEALGNQILELMMEIKQERELYYDDRSPRWQDGSKGMDYLGHTEILEDYQLDMEDFVNNIEEWIKPVEA